MKCGVIGFLISLLIPFISPGSNVRIISGPKISGIDGNCALIEITLAWDNSWRNIYNYDAVYLFGKYHTEEYSAWEHMFWEEDPSKQIVSEGYGIEVVNGGRGIFLFRNTLEQVQSPVTLQLKWRYGENTKNPLTERMVDEGAYLSVQGIEMVYVPSAPFYAGDGVSQNDFSDPCFGMIPAVYDIIGTNNSFIYSSNGSESAVAAVKRAADRYNQAILNPSNRHDWCGTAFPAWWRVDFVTPKKICYFGVSGVCWQGIPCVPEGNWVLEASNDAGKWDVLWQGGSEYWGLSSVSYPVQKAIKIEEANRGYYRYYQIRVDQPKNASAWNNIRIANVAMTNVDLDTVYANKATLIDGAHQGFPVHYPDGVSGFYTMKYELTQEQYVTFLNQLPRSAQYSRTIGGLLDRLKEGDFVFGETPEKSSHRNGIIVHKRPMKGSNEPYQFACNLDMRDIAGYAADGQSISCNYLSPADMLAYADWSGLRPLSELEYEKMCRGKYPFFPGEREFAWENRNYQMVQALTNEGGATESPVGEVNVNAGNHLKGPVRAGMFTRPGNREKTGSSFWGISDLSGNLSEIYCNAEIYGRQLDGRSAGNGELTLNGGYDVDRAYWPVELEAYGVRGGDFTSGTPALAMADRSHAAGYFTQFTERNPEAGIRLGFSREMKNEISVLTLQNGLTSGTAIVYDTVCDNSVYLITGNKWEDIPVHYLWFKSIDNGISWQLLEGEVNSDLEVCELTKEVETDRLQRFLYKRIVYTPDGRGESVVGLTIYHGYRADRLRDSIWPCMESRGFTLTTQLPAKFIWECLESGKELYCSSQNELSCHYETSVNDFKIGDEKRPNGHYTIQVRIKMAKGCESHVNLGVVAVPHTKNPWLAETENFAFNSAGNFQVDHGRWGGPYSWSYSLYSRVASHKIVKNTGVMTGASDTMCSIVVGLVCDDWPDKEWTKNMKEIKSYTTVGASNVKLLAGSYQMECWGAQGGTACQDWATTASGANGGYASGILDLDKMTLFYLYVGGYGGGNGAGPGWNGGGQGGPNNDGEPGGSGGGASDIRLTGHIYTRIMVAGGGGGAQNYWNGSGTGGGINGGGGGVAGGTQTSGASLGTGGTGGRDASGKSGGGGGGGGYYGGYGAGTGAGPGGGGSGFVSGMAGCNAIDANGRHTGQANHYSGYIFREAKMLNGQRGGNGLIRITVK